MIESVWKQQMNWAFYVSQDYRLTDVQFKQDALSTACKVMRHARRVIEIIIDRLKSRGYEFVEPKRVHIKPSPDVADWAAEFEAEGIYLPISFQAWLQEIGTINLMGTDKSWRCCGYHGLENKEVWYTDPLVVEVDKEYIYSEFENWRYQTSEEGFEEIGPFCIPFAPDDLHKANISGGAPYEIHSDKPIVDPLVLNERHGFSFFAYVRHACSWGGFPGFEIIDDAPIRFLAEMQEGLESF
jgi:hypothetical protein